MFCWPWPATPAPDAASLATSAPAGPMHWISLDFGVMRMLTPQGRGCTAESKPTVPTAHTAHRAAARQHAAAGAAAAAARSSGCSWCHLKGGQHVGVPRRCAVAPAAFREIGSPVSAGRSVDTKAVLGKQKPPRQPQSQRYSSVPSHGCAACVPRRCTPAPAASRGTGCPGCLPAGRWTRGVSGRLSWQRAWTSAAPPCRPFCRRTSPGWDPAAPASTGSRSLTGVVLWQHLCLCPISRLGVRVTVMAVMSFLVGLRAGAGASCQAGILQPLRATRSASCSTSVCGRSFRMRVEA